jgi:hypothetical protein
MKLVKELVTKPSRYFKAFVLKNEKGAILGMLEKYGNTATEEHPWKAFLGYGFSRKYLGSFLKNEGGEKAAIATVYRAVNEEINEACRFRLGMEF